MSRQLTPPASVTSYAKHTRCSDCESTTGRPWIDEHGTWHVRISHDDWCPVLAGRVSKTDMHVSAVRQSLREGHRAAVVYGTE